MLSLIENLVEVQAEEIPDINESTSANNFDSIIILWKRWKNQRTLKMYTKTMFGKWRRYTGIIVEVETPSSMCNGNKATRVGYA